MEPNITLTPNQSSTIQVASTPSIEISSAPVSPQSYTRPPEFPTQQILEGIRFDFNDGLRIKFPQGNIRYHLIFIDTQTGTVMHNADVQPGAYISSTKKFFINYKIIIYHANNNRQPIYTHTYNAHSKDVVIQFPDGAIGDTIGWFSYMERFQKKHNCKLTCIVPKFAVQIFQKQYPNIRLVTHGDPLDISPYATYYMGLFFKCNTDMQPIDFRQVGLHRIAAYILGIDTEDIPPRVDLSAERQIKEKYCVINTEASSMTKQWNNPVGWQNVIAFLREQGYRIYCINKDKTFGQDMYWQHLPWGVQDATGTRPLQQRINLIKDADFFIGLSSGMTWLAWCCKVPIVLISGFTLPFCEFYTPYRIINYNVCTGCWDDRKQDFDHQDYTWCPRHKGTPQQFQCTRAISAEHVINTIKKIPSFRPLQVPTM